MDQHTQVFYGTEPRESDAAYSSEPPYYEDESDSYGYDRDDSEAYSDETGYEVEDIDEAYELYAEDTGEKRFHVAMNMFDLLSVLLGIVTILVLTSLVVSMVSWFRTDIFHSFVILQSRIQ